MTNTSGSYPAIHPKLITTSAFSTPYTAQYSSRTHPTMPSAIMISPPETYFLTKPTPHVPNSPLPVLVYRSVIPVNPTPETICAAIEPKDWIKGGVFKHYPAHHFHSVTHELYAVFKGHSRLLLGRGPLDAEGGIEVDLRVGDCIVLPSGVAHCCREFNLFCLWPSLIA
jgi:mannose-6-phosphate isomerase-like protein (cupin superfamily)